MKRILFTVLVALIPLAFINSFHLISSYQYASDFGRDLTDMYQIAKGHFTLLGPKLSFGGIYAGPYYYYLFAFMLKISHFLPEALVIGNACIFCIAFIVGVLWLYKQESFNLTFAIISMYWVGLTPYFIYAARRPGNAFSYLPLMLMLLLAFPWLSHQKRLIIWLVYGFLVGIVINTHLVAGIVFAVLFITSMTVKSIKAHLAVIPGIVMSYTPLILFEIRHHFVIFKNTFFDKSYLAFTQNTNIAEPIQSSPNPLQNIHLLLEYFTEWSGIQFAVILAIIILLMLKNKSKLSLASGAILSFIVLAIAARSQVAIHYFFPFILIAQVSIIFLLKQQKHASLILLILMIINLFNFPTHLYAKSAGNINDYRRFVADLSASNFLQQLNPKSFNVYVVQDVPISTLGWEYRYFLTLTGYRALGPGNFKQSQHLLMIFETDKVDDNSVQSWELSEFGPKNRLADTMIKNHRVTLFSK